MGPVVGYDWDIRYYCVIVIRTFVHNFYVCGYATVETICMYIQYFICPPDISFCIHNLRRLVLSHHHGPLARYVKLRVAHAPGILGTFSSPPRVSDPDMPHGTCVRHVSWCMPGSLTSNFLWSRWRWKRSRHSRCMRNTQFYVSGKRSMESGLSYRPGEVIYSINDITVLCYLPHALTLSSVFGHIVV